MQLKVKLAAIASALAVAASLGTAFAGPALAADEVNLCVQNYPGDAGLGCIFAFPRAGDQVLMSPTSPSSLWNAPTGSSKGQISYYGDGGSGASSLCLEVDSGIKVQKSDGIRLEQCTGKASEEWLPEADGKDSHGNSIYIYKSEYGSNLCLNADPNGSPAAPSAATCNRGSNEQWIVKQY